MERLGDYENMIGDILKNNIIPNEQDFFDAITRGVHNIINTLCNAGYIHGDLHWNNIYITSQYYQPPLDMEDWNLRSITTEMLDFGWAVKAKCNRELELLALLRSSYMKDYQRYGPQLQFIIKDMMKQHNIGSPNIEEWDFYKINDRYNELFNKIQNI